MGPRQRYASRGPQALGVLANLVLVAMGFVWVRPAFGAPGLLWIVVMAGITIVNARRLIAWPR